jgi:hypothetical protein
MVMLAKFAIIISILLSCRAFCIDTDFSELLSEKEQIKRNENIKISIGDSKEIAMTEGASIQISRRGIIDAQILPSKIRIVGIKTGLVVLTLVQNGKKDEDLKYFVSVVPKSEEIPKELEDLREISEGTGLQFQEKTKEIKGTADNYLLFYKTKALCDQKKTCSFTSVLSEKARDALSTYLEGLLGGDFENIVKANGSILVLTPCSANLSEKERGKIVDHLIGNDLLKKNLLVACKKDWYSGSYTLFSKMIVMENSTAKDDANNFKEKE